ncbi:MAG: DUF2628 domain-containing protein [Zoogloeaceae bacterium]|nr:DUF2628 domain-containing protein [Zoogloeaceae bacterium]
MLKPSEELKAAHKNLTGAERLKVAINLWAFFFSFIYLFILGLWRQAVLVLLIAIGLGVTVGLVGLFLPEKIGDALGQGVFIAFNILVAFRANTWYYREKTKGGAGWTL